MSAATPLPVPDELETVPPGAVLAELLEALAVEEVSGFDTVRLLEAAYRQLSHVRAVFLSILRESGLRRPGSVATVERTKAPNEFACEEARAALVWSRARAASTYGFATDVFDRLPVLGAAMLAGALDEPRARAFVEWTQGLTDAQAETVCEQLLPEAAGLMVGELIDRIKRACLAIDPDWAAKKYREAVRTRRVAGSRNPDGTANLGGYQQPIDRIAAASEHIDTLARACKRAGDQRLIDHIRSDLFLGMVDGTFEGLTDSEVVEHVLAHPTPSRPTGLTVTVTVEAAMAMGAVTTTAVTTTKEASPTATAEPAVETAVVEVDLAVAVVPRSAGRAQVARSARRAFVMPEVRRLASLDRRLSLDRGPRLGGQLGLRR